MKNQGRRFGETDPSAHLLEHGHRRVGFGGETMAIATTGRRLSGYQAALVDVGLDADPELMVVDTVTAPDAQDAIAHLLQLSRPATAICAPNASRRQIMLPAQLLFSTSAVLRA